MYTFCLIFSSYKLSNLFVSFLSFFYYQWIMYQLLYSMHRRQTGVFYIKRFLYWSSSIYNIVLIESLNPISIEWRRGCGGWNERILCVNNGLEREQNKNNQAIKVSSLRLPRIQLIISRHQSGRLLREVCTYRAFHYYMHYNHCSVALN
jgi:hypothetical protein